MSTDPCATCTDRERLEGFVCGHTRCRVCGTEVFSFDIDRAPTWSITVPADAAARARAGDVGAMLPWLLGETFTPPVPRPRPFGQLCASFHPDLDRWAAAFAATDDAASGWVLAQFRAGVATLQREAAAAVGLVAHTFAVSVDAPSDAGHVQRASVAPFDGRLYVAPRDRLYAWTRGEAPRRVWRGSGIPTPFGGPWWGLLEPRGQPLLRVDGDRVHRWGEPPHEWARPSGARHGAVTVVHWAIPGGGPLLGRADVVTDDGALVASFPSRGGAVRPHAGGWLSLDERDDAGAVVPVSFRDASWRLVWRSPDRREETDAETQLVSANPTVVETLTPRRDAVERRDATDGATTGPPEVRTASPVLHGGFCGHGQGRVWCDGPDGRVWSLEARPEWTGSARLFLAVGEAEVWVVDALTGARSEPVARPDPVARVVGSAAHGGMFVSAGALATYVGAGGVPEPWRELPFEAHPSGAFPDGRVVWSCAHDEPRAIVARHTGDGWRTEGVVEGARLAHGPRGRQHWLADLGVGPVFLAETRWHATAWPGLA